MSIFKGKIVITKHFNTKPYWTIKSETKGLEGSRENHFPICPLTCGHLVEDREVKFKLKKVGFNHKLMWYAEILNPETCPPSILN